MNQNINRFMIIICKCLLIGIPLFAFLSWGFIDSAFMKERIREGVFFQPTITPAGLVLLDQVQWTKTSQIFGFLWQFLGSLPDLAALWILLKIFKNYQNGLIFTIQNAKHYRKLGFFFLIDALLVKPISGMFLTLALTWGNQPGKRYITIDFGTPSLRPLFLSVVLIVISWVMIEASKIQAEQELTV